MKTIFSIPFFQYSIENWGEIKNKILHEYNNSLIEKTEAKEAGSSKLYTDFFNIFQTNSPPEYLKNVLDILSPYTNKFLTELRDNNLYHKNDIGIGCAWFEKLIKGMGHSVHNHGACGFSSVCYIEFDNKIHLPTNFLSPFGDFAWGNSQYYQPDIKEGDIIFFPSFLQHYAPLNSSDKERIIFSFNIK
jgi:hypothetical protein